MIDSAAARARLYQDARPDYPEGLLGFLDRHCGVSAPVVADIGLGTGLSTSLFLGWAAALTGVEPDDQMRAVATERLTTHGVQILAGCAESTGLPSRSVDLVVAASCAEWFDAPRACREFSRILAPRGKVLLVWKHRVAIDRTSAAWDRLWVRHLGPRLGPAPEDIERFVVPRLLAREIVRYGQIDWHRFDRERLHKFARSSGYAPRPHQGRRLAALRGDIDQFAADYQPTGLNLAFYTVAYLGEPTDAASRSTGR